MFERLASLLGLGALLCACSGHYEKPDCAAYGGCAKASMCSGKACGRDAAVAHAGTGASVRARAVRVSKDAGVIAALDGGDIADASQLDPAQPEPPHKQSKQGKQGAAAASSKKAAQAGLDAGSDGASADAATDTQAACEERCGPCQACDGQKRCQPVTGRDDADSCSDMRSCSSRGECLRVSEAQTDAQDYAELTQSYAQVLTFSEPATIQEIRLDISCDEDDQVFPAVWLAAAPGGMPSDTIIATANVFYQAPTEGHAFALLELSKVLEEPATGPFAIVVSQTDMSCNIRLNKDVPYRNGQLFSQSDTLWMPSEEGSMVFQVLSSQ